MSSVVVILVLALLGVAVVHAVWWFRCRRLVAEFGRRSDEQRVREDRLREDYERDRSGREAVMDCMLDGVVVLDGEGRVRTFNRAVVRLFQVGGDLRGLTLLEALRRHELAEFAERARAEGQALDLELEQHGRSAVTLQVNAVSFLDGTGGGKGVILVFHDVSRLKDLERTRRDFVANVSHELRTPLSLIKGYVETLIDGASSDPEVSGKFLRTIEKHANRLAFLIEDLLAISQLESGQALMNRCNGELRPLVGRVVEDLATKAEARGMRLLNEVPAELRLRVDPDRLQQVLFNLVDNGIKYGRAGGTVRVGGRVDPDAGRVEVWVSDEGQGIPAEALERVFERFYRVDAARSREQGGTGLGLAIVKHIVQAHGGEVRAESEVGRGTTFRVLLPWETSDAG